MRKPILRMSVLTNGKMYKRFAQSVVHLRKPFLLLCANWFALYTKRQFAGCGEIGHGKFAFVDSCCLSDSRIQFFFIGIKSAHLQPEERLMIVLINHDGQSVFLPVFPQRLKEVTAEWRTWREKFLSDVYHIPCLQSTPITGSRNAAMT